MDAGAGADADVDVDDADLDQRRTARACRTERGYMPKSKSKVDK